MHQVKSLRISDVRSNEFSEKSSEKSLRISDVRSNEFSGYLLQRKEKWCLGEVGGWNIYLRPHSDSIFILQKKKKDSTFLSEVHKHFS